MINLVKLEVMIQSVVTHLKIISIKKQTNLYFKLTIAMVILCHLQIIRIQPNIWTNNNVYIT